MRKKLFSQEGLKLLACVTMLIDHLGATLFPEIGLRIIGRIAFPIYCFLLTEGIAYSRNHRRYGVRLLIGALLSEIPYDLLFYGRMTWAHQSVMVTLLLGFIMVLWGRKRNSLILPFAVCFFAAEFWGTDYGGWGIALIALFAMTTNLAGSWIWQTVGMAAIFFAMDSYRVNFGGIRIPIQMFGLLALVPIWLYSGQKLTNQKWLQWVFYLFYPAHLAALLILKLLQ